MISGATRSSLRGCKFQKFPGWDAPRPPVARKLYSQHLKEGESVQESMTELFEAYSVIGDPVSEEEEYVMLCNNYMYVCISSKSLLLAGM